MIGWVCLGRSDSGGAFGAHTQDPVGCGLLLAKESLPSCMLSLWVCSPLPDIPIPFSQLRPGCAVLLCGVKRLWDPVPPHRKFSGTGWPVRGGSGLHGLQGHLIVACKGRGAAEAAAPGQPCVSTTFSPRGPLGPAGQVPRAP